MLRINVSFEHFKTSDHLSFEVCCFSLDGTPLRFWNHYRRKGMTRNWGKKADRIETHSSPVISYPSNFSPRFNSPRIYLRHKNETSVFLEWKNFSSKEKSSHPRDIHRIHFVEAVRESKGWLGAMR